MDALVSTDWLAEHGAESDVRIVDASWHLPAAGRDAKAEFAQGHIPRARFFDIDAISDRATHLPHMLSLPADFALAMQALGIGGDHRVVVYDAHGLMSAPRAWWMLRVFGHDRVAVLDGGMPKWKREGRPLENVVAPAPPARFHARFRPALVRDKAAMIANLASAKDQVIDARSAGRFAGSAPEPRPGLRGGHIPGSHNLPFDRLSDPATNTMRSVEELRALFAAAGVDPAKPIVASCGSGITACVLAFGLYRIGHDGASVYDGSWAEWGEPGDTPVATG